MKKALILFSVILFISCEPISLKTTIDEMVLGWTREVVCKSPEDGADVAEKTPKLDWEDAGGATGYELQIVEAEDQFGSADIIETEKSEYEIPAGLTICDTRYWRVRAVKGKASGDWSESRVFSIAVSTTPKLIGQLDSDDGIPPSPLGIAIKEDYAFLINASTDDRLTIIDISDPVNPILKTVLDRDPGLAPFFTGEYLYCNNSISNDISKIDLSDPLNPVQVGAALSVLYDHDQNGGTANIEYSWNMVYHVSGDDYVLLTAYDRINDPPESTGVLSLDFSVSAIPEVLGFLFETTGEPFGITNASSTGFVTVNGEGIYSFSHINQAVDGFYEVDTMDRGWIRAEGNNAFVSNLNGPLIILDISNPSSLELVYSYNPGEGTILPIVSGYYLFTGLFTSEEFTIMDVRNPSAPILVSEGNTGWVGEIIGNYAYGFDNSGGKFFIWDLVPGD